MTFFFTHRHAAWSRPYARSNASEIDCTWALAGVPGVGTKNWNGSPSIINYYCQFIKCAAFILYLHTDLTLQLVHLSSMLHGTFALLSLQHSRPLCFCTLEFAAFVYTFAPLSLQSSNITRGIFRRGFHIVAREKNFQPRPLNGHTL